jgi:hypothetical protein
MENNSVFPHVCLPVKHGLAKMGHVSVSDTGTAPAQLHVSRACPYFLIVTRDGHG